MDLRQQVTETYLAGLRDRVSDFELELARIAFVAGWDLALATKQEIKNDSTN